jgi:hypothetical protein
MRMGFFIFVTSISPIFSARCPYKTPALELVTALFRRHVHRPLYNHFHSLFLPFISAILFIIFVILSPILYGCHRLFFATSSGKMGKFVRGHTRLTEEEDVIKDEAWDLDILASADALQTNDQLLGTTMASALGQSNVSWSEALEFLLKVTGNRLPLSATTLSDTPVLINIRTLTMQAQKAITSIFVHHVVNSESFHKIQSEINQANTNGNLRSRQDLLWVISTFVSLFNGRHARDVHPTHTLLVVDYFLKSKQAHMIDTVETTLQIVLIENGVLLWLVDIFHQMLQERRNELSIEQIFFLLEWCFDKVLAFPKLRSTQGGDSFMIRILPLSRQLCRESPNEYPALGIEFLSKCLQARNRHRVIATGRDDIERDHLRASLDSSISCLYEQILRALPVVGIGENLAPRSPPNPYIISEKFTISVHQCVCLLVEKSVADRTSANQLTDLFLRLFVLPSTELLASFLRACMAVPKHILESMATTLQLHLPSPSYSDMRQGEIFLLQCLSNSD